MTDQYRVAIIGCGRRGSKLAPAFDKDPRCEVAALVDANEETARTVAGEHAIDAPVFSDHKEMLQELQPDVAVIALWTSLHLPILRDCVEAGVRGVLCEKPMAPTWGDALEMARLARENDVVLNFCHQRRFNPGVLKARELIEAGTFGAVQRLEHFSPTNSLDCGCHSLDFGFMFNSECPVEWVMGQVEPGKVPEWFDVRFAEHAMALFRYENGIYGTLESGGDREMGTGVRVLCEDGLLEVAWGGEFQRAVVFSDSSWEPPEIGEAAGLEPTADALVTSMETGEESELDVAKSLRSNEVVFALYESSRRRDCIHLPIETRENPFVAMVENGEITPKVDPHEGY